MKVSAMTAQNNTPKQWLVGSPNASVDTQKKVHYDKVQLKLPSNDWTLIILFLLSLSAVGLQFYPMALLSLGLLIYAFVHDRYSFLLMTMIIGTSEGFLPAHALHGIHTYDLVLLASIFGLFFYKKNLLVKKCMCLIGLYALYLLGMATLSDETLAIQFLTIRQYLSIFVMILPLWIFANKEFDIQLLYRKALGFFLVICAFYVIDGFILQGWVLLPGTYNWGEAPSSITHLLWNPLGTWMPRKYPSGCFIIIIATFPLAKYYKLKWWQWGLVVLALAAMRTFSVIAAFIITLGIFQGKAKKMLLYGLIVVASMTVLYSVDAATGRHLRIASSIDQFTNLNAAVDEEDLAEFGTGRMAQVIPKWEALVEQNCQWQGFGFIHPTKTTLPRYQINNALYVDIQLSDEAAAAVEVTQFNTIINIGIIGLIIQALFFAALWLLVRRNPNAPFYLSTLLIASIMGLAGFTGLNSQNGLFWVATALGAVLLTSQERDSYNTVISSQQTSIESEKYANNNN